MISEFVTTFKIIFGTMKCFQYFIIFEVFSNEVSSVSSGNTN